jgi:hypothetical protein
MKKSILVLALVFLLAPMADAQGPKFGIGVFGGSNIPIAQEDQASGSAFGVKARIKLLPFLVVEPNFTSAKWGDPDPIDGFDLGIEGSKVTSYGVDANLGGLPGSVGFKPFALVGAAVYSIKNDDTGYDESKMGVAFGLGFAIGLSPKFDLDVRGKAIVAPQEEGSKKAVLILGGITYNIGPGM